MNNKNELAIIEWVIWNLSSGVDTEVIIAELYLARKILKKTKSYDAEKIVQCIFTDKEEITDAE